MLPKNQILTLQKLLNIKNQENVVLFLSRLDGWINNNTNSPKSLLKGLNTILQDIHKKEIKDAQENKKIEIKTNNIILKKYAVTIVELHRKGLGARKIANYLMLNHRAKISYSTIYRFIKEQGLCRKKANNG